VAYFRQYQQIAATLATDLSAHPKDVVKLVGNQAAQLHSAEKELRQLRLAYSTFEAQDMLANAEKIGDHSVVMKAFENRPVNEIRALGNEFKEQAKVVSLLATFDGKKLVLVATCGLESGLSARELLNRQLAAINGRGGGDDQIAQGGATATPEQLAAFFKNAQRLFQ